MVDFDGYEELAAMVDAEIDPAYSMVDADESLHQEHIVTGTPLQLIAHKHGRNLNEAKYWGEPVDINDDSGHTRVNLIQEFQNPFIEYSRALAAAVQFPVNTAFLHGLGVVSAAMLRGFWYFRHETKKHPSLYVVGAQPPSSGKSPVNNKYTAIVSAKIRERNEKKSPYLMTAKQELQELESRLNSKKTPPAEKLAIAKEIQEQHEKIALYEPYLFAITDTTPEALEQCASRQGGFFTIISDEMEGVSVLFGNNYGDKAPNLGVVLNGFDGGFQNSLRVGRPGYCGNLYGGVAVLAQESTVRAILNAGRAGGGSRGVCERFLIVHEPNMLHLRDPRKNMQIPREILSDYMAMIDNILDADNVTIKIGDQANNFLMDILTGLQSKISDGGQFSSELMRSVIGKADTQICKLATTLHICREWWPTGGQSREIQLYDMQHAASMYVQLIKSFYSAAENEGIDGILPQIRVAARKLSQIISDTKKPRNRIKVSDFSDALRGTKPFSEMKNLRKNMRDNVVPELEQKGFIVFDFDNGTMIINPRLKDKLGV